DSTPNVSADCHVSPPPAEDGVGILGVLLCAPWPVVVQIGNVVTATQTPPLLLCLPLSLLSRPRVRHHLLPVGLCPLSPLHGAARGAQHVVEPPSPLLQRLKRR